MILDINKSMARYKIEIHFGPKRTTKGPNVAAISFFESGNRLNGDGDEAMYLCMERDRGLALNMGADVKDREVVRGVEGCGKFIPGGQIRGGCAMCSCEEQKIIQAESLTSTLLVNLTTQKLATLLVRFFEELDNNADIYMKYHPSDIRYKAMEDVYGLDKARMMRGLTIYPLRNIVKDTMAGSSLENRFKALMEC